MLTEDQRNMFRFFYLKIILSDNIKILWLRIFRLGHNFLNIILSKGRSRVYIHGTNRIVLNTGNVLTRACMCKQVSTRVMLTGATILTEEILSYTISLIV